MTNSIIKIILTSSYSIIENHVRQVAKWLKEFYQGVPEHCALSEYDSGTLFHPLTWCCTVHTCTKPTSDGNAVGGTWTLNN